MYWMYVCCTEGTYIRTVRTYVCMYVYTYIRTFIYTYVHTYVCMYVYILYREYMIIRTYVMYLFILCRFPGRTTVKMTT